MDDLTKWILGIAGAFIVAYNLWLASSIQTLRTEMASFREKVANDSKEYASTKAIDEVRQDVKQVAQLLHELLGEVRANRRE